MHELAITENILSIAEEHAKKAHAVKVTDIHLLIGSLSSIIDDSVQFYWDMIARDTLCQGAQLHFERYPAEILCLDCGAKYSLNGELSSCPKCNSVRIKILSGNEFRVESIEIEKTEE